MMHSQAARFDRALLLHEQGRLREAFDQYTAILAADPNHAAALHYSGVVLHQFGDHAGAIERIRRAIAVDPAPAAPWANLAPALEALGRPEAAIRTLQEATRRAPHDPQILVNLAASQLALGLTADADQSARRAIAADPTFAAGWYNLALILEPQGRLLEALDAASRAATFAPDIAAHAGLLAQLQQSLDQLGAAQKTLELALARHPMVAPLHIQLAEVSERRGDLPGAMRAFERALRLEPADGSVLSRLLFLRKRACAWHDLATLQASFRDGVRARRSFLTPFSYLSDPSTRAEQRCCAETWSARFASPAGAPRRPLHAPRLRIAYLSADFHNHPTAVLTAGVFEAHDRQRLEIAGYSTGPDDGSALRARVAAALDRFVDARGLTADALAHRIRADGIDILVDLKGHTLAGTIEVLARRPAPIQVHWLGYPGTLGATCVDYLIGDRVVTPLEEAADYSEALIELPDCYQSNDRSRVAETTPSRDALGLPRNAVVLCCFNSPVKINPGVLDAWAQILSAVPEAVLWLLARGDADPVIGNLRREAGARGIAPERLVFASYRPNPDYLALYRHADLFLDTWPYNAHTTASDALWMNCPVLTWRGSTFAGRVAASLLHAVGLPALVAPDRDAYVDQAIALARDPGTRAELRSQLQGPGRASPLFDVVRFTRSLETAFAEIAGQYRAGRREAFRIAAPSD
jgi:predicted O-linked N-acetylglucosamine transferase (SPINDLY family)